MDLAEPRRLPVHRQAVRWLQKPRAVSQPLRADISLTTLFVTQSSIFRSRAALQLENLALRHQVGVLQRSARKRPRKRPRLTPVDRLLWAWLSRGWSGWRSTLAMVQPETVSTARLTWGAFIFIDLLIKLCKHLRNVKQ